MFHFSKFFPFPLALSLTLALTLSGCQNAGSDSASESSTAESTVVLDTDSMFTERDLAGTYEDAVSVSLEGNTAVAESSAVSVSGSVITLTKEGTYLLSGNLDNGRIVVDAASTDKLQLVLSNVSVTSETSAALYVKNADKVFVTLKSGSENTLANGGTFTDIDENAIDGAVFAKDDITFNGGGNLTVTSPAGHGIVGKDDVVFAGGSYTVSAASHAVDANDSVRVTNANLTAAVGKDGLHAENEEDDTLGFIYIKDGALALETADDGLWASSSMQIDGGSFSVTCADDAFHAEESLAVNGGNIAVTSCYEGLEALHVAVSGGDITLNAADDGLNAAGGTDESGFGGMGPMDFGGGPGTSEGTDGSVHISGGKLTITASGDGIDANGELKISGGEITVEGPTQGDTATLDYATTATISGGTFVGTGAAGLAQTFSSSENQGVISAKINVQAENTVLTLTNEDGEELISHTPSLSYEVVIISTPKIQKGEAYTLTIGNLRETVKAS